MEKIKCKKYSEILFEWVKKKKTPLGSSLLSLVFIFQFCCVVGGVNHP
jgi:hypothetical protein